MQLTNTNIIQYINNLDEVFGMGCKLPGRVGYTMRQNRKKLMEDYSNYEKEFAQIEYEKDSKQWNIEVQELLKGESEVNIAKINPELIMDYDVDPRIFELLGFMLDEK